MKTKWEEKQVFENKDKNRIEEWQSMRCPYCQKYHTTPYMYYFSEYRFCPNCGKDMRGDGRDDKLEKCKFEYVNACKIVTHPTPDTSKNDIYDAYAVIKALNPIFGEEGF